MHRKSLALTVWQEPAITAKNTHLTAEAAEKLTAKRPDVDCRSAERMFTRAVQSANIRCGIFGLERSCETELAAVQRTLRSTSSKPLQVPLSADIAARVMHDVRPEKDAKFL